MLRSQSWHIKKYADYDDLMKEGIKVTYSGMAGSSISILDPTLGMGNPQGCVHLRDSFSTATQSIWYRVTRLIVIYRSQKYWAGVGGVGGTQLTQGGVALSQVMGEQETREQGSKHLFLQGGWVGGHSFFMD